MAQELSHKHQTPSISDDEIKTLAASALDATCETIQERLGVESGDIAGIFYPRMQDLFVEYIRAELAFIEAED